MNSRKLDAAFMDLAQHGRALLDSQADATEALQAAQRAGLEVELSDQPVTHGGSLYWIIQDMPPEAEGTVTMELKIPARPELATVVRGALERFAGRFVSPAEVEDLKVAVGEAYTAAVLAGTRTLQVSFALVDKTLEVRIAYTPKVPQLAWHQDCDIRLVQSLADVRTETSGAQHVTLLRSRAPASTGVAMRGNDTDRARHNHQSPA